MSIGQWMLRLLFPRRERERMELRHCVMRASAEAEDVQFTIRKNGFDQHGCATSATAHHKG